MGDGQETGMAVIEEEAAGWLLLLQRPHVSETDWLAFDAWMSREPGHALAFDRAHDLWRELDGMAGAFREASNVRAAPRLPVRGPFWKWAMTAAACLALGLFSARDSLFPSVETFSTARGEHRSVTLADGSRIDLAGATRLSVRLRTASRSVTLEEGEAVFDVAHDPARPFQVAAGPSRIEDIGTEFDVRHRDGRTAVTVRSGLVQVVSMVPGQSNQPIRLYPGQQLDIVDGKSIEQVRMVTADDVFAWRNGRLICIDCRMADIVADLNAEFIKPIRVGDRAANLHFSGVLVLDNEEEVVRRLTLLAPVWSSVTPEGIMLRAK